MKVEWFKEYSQCLNRDMEFNVYGHAGEPILVFPSQNGRYFDFANNGMVATIEHLIDDGKVQLFCCDSIDQESWSDEGGDNSHRTYRESTMSGIRTLCVAGKCFLRNA